MGETLLYTVPAGDVVIVRDLLYYIDYDQTSALIGVTVLPESGSDQWVYLSLQVVPVPGTVYHWQGRQVLTEGMELLAVNLAAEMNVRISGYRLGV
jgi:hypothetical protein